MDWKCPPLKAILMWCIAASFIVMQFFLQLSIGVIANKLRVDLHIDAFGLSLLSSAYYIVYVTMQSPAGAFVDHFGVRRLLAGGSVLIIIGCTIFSFSTTLYHAIIGRILMGSGLAFAFVSTIHIARTWFPKPKQSLMIGIAETVAMSGIFLGSLFLSRMMSYVTWQQFYMYFNLFIIFMAVLAYFFILDDEDQEQDERTLLHLLKKTYSKLQFIIKEKQSWVIGTYIGLMFAVPTIFAALWGIPFFIKAYSLSQDEATLASSLLYVGIALGAPFVTWIFSHHPRRRIFLILVPLVITVLLSFVISAVLQDKLVLYTLMLSIGFVNGTFMIGFSMVGDLFDRRMKSTATGFVNTLGVVITPIASVIVGAILDLQSDVLSEKSIEIYTVAHYQIALAIIPLCTLLAAYIASLTSKELEFRD